jgi:hypothetical protein
VNRSTQPCGADPSALGGGLGDGLTACVVSYCPVADFTRSGYHPVNFTAPTSAAMITKTPTREGIPST